MQGEIIAGAIAASATVETDTITIDPDRLLDLQAGESYGAADDALRRLDFPINPERVAPVLRRLISPTKTRARIYDRDGALILDSRNLYARGDDAALRPAAADRRKAGLARARLASRSAAGSQRGDLPLYRELGPEQRQGLSGGRAARSTASDASMVRVNDRGELIVSVAVPVQRFRAVHGALLLSTQGGDIDQIVDAERLAIVTRLPRRRRRHGAAVDPARRHHRRAAPPARRRRRARPPPHPHRASRFPDFTHRRDEIGHLSGALRDMTNALYNRIEAIESFAADVAHELKNPLTSLRSRGRDAAARQDRGEPARACSAIIQHDVSRLDRLIRDISDASRLDAELQRQDAAPVDLAKLLDDAGRRVANEVRTTTASTVTLDVRRRRARRLFRCPATTSGSAR